jgi:hypothetical protein
MNMTRRFDIDDIDEEQIKEKFSIREFGPEVTAGIFIIYTKADEDGKKKKQR